jgi:hypothetical protein
MQFHLKAKGCHKAAGFPLSSKVKILSCMYFPDNSHMFLTLATLGSVTGCEIKMQRIWVPVFTGCGSCIHKTLKFVGQK